MSDSKDELALAGLGTECEVHNLLFLLNLLLGSLLKQTKFTV